MSVLSSDGRPGFSPVNSVGGQGGREEVQGSREGWQGGRETQGTRLSAAMCSGNTQM